MGRSILLACLPWTAILIASAAVLCLLARANRARLKPRRLLRLHADQRGAVQSLSFVIALPLFIMVLLLIVQVSQLMIGQIAVEYAAFAAARAAAVWIPADVDETETWNCVTEYAPAEESQLFPVDLGIRHELTPEGYKYAKIRMAAAMACLPVSPSRSLPVAETQSNQLAALERVYKALVPNAAESARVSERLKNKLMYTLSTDILAVDVRFYHYQSHHELPLAIPVRMNPMTGEFEYGVPPDRDEYRPGRELGWQDPISVTVRYKLALLPGPGRLLFGSTVSDGETSVYRDVYTYLLTASATLGNEGEKPAYAHYILP